MSSIWLSAFFLLIHEPKALSFLSLPIYLLAFANTDADCVCVYFPMYACSSSYKKCLIYFHYKSKNMKNFHFVTVVESALISCFLLFKNYFYFLITVDF